MIFFNETFFGFIDAVACAPMSIDFDITKVTLMNGVFDQLFVTYDTNVSFDDDLEIWDDYTIMNADLNGNFNASNVYFNIADCTDVLIRRHEIDEENNWITVGHKIIYDNNEINISGIDYTAKGDVEYEYAFVPILSNSEASASFNQIKSDFNGIYLYDGIDYYGTEFNLESITTTRNKTCSFIPLPYKKYPKFIDNSISNYESGNVGGYFTYKGNFENNTKYRKSFMDFLTNDRVKLLKISDGRCWLVMINESPTETKDSVGNDLTITKFNWTELDECNSDKSLNESHLFNIPSQFWIS